MIIRHIGHASFRITLNDGRSIVTDPYDPAVGYDMPATKADIVTMSHGHHDHNYIGALDPSLTVTAVGTTTYDGVKIEGFPTFHDDAFGAKRGQNTVFVIEADGQRIAHMGDLGHTLNDDQIAQLGALDALLIPVGGVFTINALQAAELTWRISARVTVPMHYLTDRLTFDLGSVDDYLSALGAEKVISDALDLDAVQPPVVVLRSGQGL